MLLFLEWGFKNYSDNKTYVSTLLAHQMSAYEKPELLVKSVKKEINAGWFSKLYNYPRSIRLCNSKAIETQKDPGT